MNIDLDVQREVNALPKDEDLLLWVSETLMTENKSDTELTIRFVTEKEISDLNEIYRNKKGSTNVLSFPFEAPVEIELNLLGDLVICTDVVKKEATQQHKEEIAHWAHMVVHGTLHLLGYDHQTDEQADVMESKEIKILSQLGYSDPYQEIEE